MTPPDPLLGQTFGGHRVERLLGRGGMGAVYLARRADGGAVVLKFLAPEVARDAGLRARFVREGKALEKIPPSPFVVNVEGLGEDDGRLFLVMEYVEGVSLLGRIQRQGRLPAAEAARLAADVARGLTVVHAQGILHRDIKPGNVLVTPAGRAKLVDFGLAKDLFRTALTVPGQLMGTAKYMAPEQWSGGAADARSDVFSLGATLYYALVGEPPFEGEDLGELADQAESGDFPLPREVVPDLPAELELVVLRMLMPEPDERYATAAECAKDLEGVLEGRPAHVPCLVGAAGARHPLIPELRYTLGRDPSCDVVVEGGRVSRRHAQVRREPEGYVLCDLNSSHGTFVDGERVEDPRPLRAGAKVRLGDSELNFEDPRRVTRAAPILQDVQRQPVPLPIVELLAQLGDPRALLFSLEALTPDPWAEREEDQQLGALLGAQVASSIAARRRELSEGVRVARLTRLPQVARQQLGADPTAWLAWYAQAPGRFSPQLVPRRALRSLQLRVEAGRASPGKLALPESGAILVGRDPQCHLRMSHPGAPRLHCTLLRLQRRMVARGAEGAVLRNGAPLATGFLDPGDCLGVGDVQAILEAAPTEPPRASGGVTEVDGPSFQALWELRHPSTIAASVGFVGGPARIGGVSQRLTRLLYPRDAAAGERFAAALSARVAEHAQRALQALPTLLGADAGTDPAAWRLLLAECGPPRSAQIAPLGWAEVLGSERS